MEYLLSLRTSRPEELNLPIRDTDLIFTRTHAEEKSTQVPSDFPEKETNLLQMCSSELFTNEMLVEYICKKYDIKGVHQYLINKLYSMPHYEMDFYITFLVQLAITRNSPVLEQFLSHLSEQNLSFYLKMMWCLQAYQECCKLQQYTGWKDRLEKLERMIEMGMVNSAVTKDLLLQAQQENISQEDVLKIMEKFKDKEYRSNYNIVLNKFISNLIKISIYLKQYQETERKQRLKEYIQKLNNYMHLNRINNKGVDYFQGILIPFAKQKGEKFHSNFLVNIVEGEFSIFNTKKRAPYKVVFETVDMSEMKEHMQDFEKLSFCQSYENVTTNSGLDELSEVKSESSVDIDREQFKDLAKFAEQRRIDEIEQEKGVIRSVLTTKNVEQYTMRKLDSLVKEAAQNESPLKKSRASTQSTGIDTSFSSSSTISQRVSVSSITKKEQEKKSKAREKFDRIFPVNEHHSTRRHSLTNVNALQMSSGSHNNSRSNSISSDSGNNAITPSTKNGVSNMQQPRKSSGVKLQQSCQQQRHRRNSLHKDVKIKDVIDFFRYLKQSYTNKFTKINSIYKYLHYDVIEATVYQHNPDRDLKEFEFPRSFGPWGQLWEDKQQILKEASPYKILESYRLRPFMIKGGDDLRQELLAMNMIQKFQDIFKKAGIPLFLKPYEIIVTSESSGFIEFLPNTLSIDALKKSVSNFKNLNDFYKRTFEDYFEEAQKNFIESLAGYSFVCYILQIKDRHNGNILIDNAGHIIHIDFGFILSIAPGGINFEKAHFKLTNEYLMLMGGKESEQFGYFKSLLVRAFIEAKKHVDAICNLVQIMQNNSTLPCFEQFDMIQFRGRFKENYTDKEFMDYVEELIRRSMNRWSTYQYDKFQQITNGILP